MQSSATQINWRQNSVKTGLSRIILRVLECVDLSSGGGAFSDNVEVARLLYAVVIFSLPPSFYFKFSRNSASYGRAPLST
jgi:hypothetical protein